MSNGVPVPGRVVLLSERGYTACSVVHNTGEGRMDTPGVLIGDFDRNADLTAHIFHSRQLLRNVVEQ